MIHYIFQIIAFQLLFLMVYDIFLRKETFFKWNRIYLLVTPVLSVLLPLIKITSLKESIHQNYIIQLPAILVGNYKPQSEWNLISSWINNDVFWILWILGILVSFTVFCFKYYQITKLKKNGSRVKLEGVPVIILKNSDTAFSFFNTIFLGEKLSESQKSTILLHEKTHVEQLHSIDLVVFEVFRMVLWFNPLIYIYQKRMVMLQEYIADAYVAYHKNKREYYQDLLSQVFNTQKISFINPFFNHSLIKKRIIMLQKSKSKKTRLLKYLAIIPVIFAMLIYTSCAQEVGNKINESNSVSNKNEALEEGLKGLDYIDDSNTQVSVPFTVIDKVPTYPGCFGDNEVLKKCMSQNILKFVGNEFNTKVAKESNINGKQRIVVLFKIDQSGNITDLKAKADYTVLEKEAIRVVSKLPQMKPGEHEGKIVAVQYSLPIVFVME